MKRLRLIFGEGRIRLRSILKRDQLWTYARRRRGKRGNGWGCGGGNRRELTWKGQGRRQRRRRRRKEIGWRNKGGVIRRREDRTRRCGNVKYYKVLHLTKYRQSKVSLWTLCRVWNTPALLCARHWDTYTGQEERRYTIRTTYMQCTIAKSGKLFFQGLLPSKNIFYFNAPLWCGYAPWCRFVVPLHGVALWGGFFMSLSGVSFF